LLLQRSPCLGRRDCTGIDLRRPALGPWVVALRRGSPDAYIYVDAPAGTQLEVSASTGVSIFAFVDCTARKWDVCTFGLATNAVPLAPPDAAARLFAVEHVDVDCGDFTFHAAAR
jgi:hypothetical protein